MKLRAEEVGAIKSTKAAASSLFVVDHDPIVEGEFLANNSEPSSGS
jgi:hypothetical protein